VRKTLFIFLLIFLFFSANFVYAVSDSANVNLQVEEEQERPVSGGGGPIYFNIKNVIAGDITANSAKITWLTTKFSVCNFYWGLTSDYEKEIISETQEATGHLVYLDRLYPSTVYYYKITCQTENLEKDQTSGQQFKTLLTLNNVSNFTAKSQDDSIVLAWQNPTDEKFAGIKILRSEEFFPFGLQNGIIIYDGYGSSFVDTNVTDGKIYYYTIFAYDKNGNYSSGAITYALFGKAIVSPPQIIPPSEDQIIPKVTINDFKFISQEQNIKVENNEKITIENNKHLTISIDAGKISDQVETITITINKDGQEFSYLMKFRKESNAYEVSFTTPNEAGNYPVKINFLDYKNRIVKQINGILNIFKISKKLDWRPVIVMWLEILVLLLLLYWFISNNRKKLKFIRN
jgi:hypothetical protein